jgi:hypothetical protein
MKIKALNKAIDEGCSPEFVLFITTAPDDHKAVEKLLQHYEQDKVSSYPSSHFYEGIWTGDIDQTYRHGDVENTEMLEKAFPDR